MRGAAPVRGSVRGAASKSAGRGADAVPPSRAAAAAPDAGPSGSSRSSSGPAGPSGPSGRGRHGSPIGYCQIVHCGARQPSWTAYRHHLQNVHHVLDLCPICLWTVHGDRTGHLRCHEMKRDWECRLCSGAFLQKRALHGHLLYYHRRPAPLHAAGPRWFRGE